MIYKYRRREIDKRGKTPSDSMKKSRLDDDANDDRESIITDSAECRTLPKPIVADEFIVDVPLRDAYIGILKDKRDTATAIKNITSILPGFCHLKRCSNGQLLLAYVRKPIEQHDNDINASFTSESDLKQFLNDKNFNLELFDEHIVILSVPERSPRTKSQAKTASEIWPVNFHPDASIELLLNGNFFNSTQLDIIDACMKLCIEASKQESFGNSHCNGSAVILDPNNNGISKIVAIASCRINEHPMWHAAMLAVDLVAKYRGGGAWKLKSTFETLSNENNDGYKRKFPLNPPLCYPLSLNTLHIPDFVPSTFENCDVESDDANDSNNCPYLCTNYWVFLMEEPCPMCAMALLHSRVAMVFYGAPNKSRGILGSRALLHTMPGLNHRYKVWSDVLGRDCQRTAMEIAQRNVMSVI